MAFYVNLIYRTYIIFNLLFDMETDQNLKASQNSDYKTYIY